MIEFPLTVDEAANALNARDLAGTGKEIPMCVDLLGRQGNQNQTTGGLIMSKPHETIMRVG